MGKSAHHLETAQEGLVRPWKRCDQVRCTHFLKTAEGGTCQDTVRNKSNKRHSHSGDRRDVDLSGYRKKLPSKAHSLPGSRKVGGGLSGHRKRVTKQGTLTSWRPQRGQGDCQGTEGKQPSYGLSLSGDHRGMDWSSHRKKVTKRRALTSWRSQRDGLLSPWDESNRARALTSLRPRMEGPVRA